MSDGLKLSGKRKLAVVLSVSGTIIGLASFFLWHGKIEPDQWVDLARWIGLGGMTGFVGGNVSEHITDLLAARKS